MSLKSTRRSRRRTDDEIEQDFKLPTANMPKKDLSNKLTDVQDNTHKNGVDDDVGNLKGFVQNDNNDTTVETHDNNGPLTRARSNTPQNKKELKNNGDVSNDNVNNDKEDNVDKIENEKTVVIDVSTSENGDDSDKTENQRHADKKEKDKSEGVKNSNYTADDEAEEMEALVVDVDEHESELEFADNSETESHKDSPNSLRCKTRRSQTRNIPTPKTPKSIIIDIEETKKDEEVIIVKPADTVTPAQDNVSTSTPNRVEEDDDDDDDDDCITVTNDTQESLDNLSTKVQIPNDETRNTEITFNEEHTTDEHSFLNIAKEKSFAEILRRTSSRRPIRSTSTIRWNNYDNVLLNRSRLSLRPSVERLSGVKRKNSNEMPDNLKRARSDSNNGFLSYISSPISNLRSKFTKSDLTSSTPKLTGYKEKIFETDDVGKIDIDVDLGDPTTEKKWCIIM